MDYLSEMFSAGVWGTSPPTPPEWITWIHRNLSDTHCEECLVLDDRWFLKSKSPKWPHHPRCHCIQLPIPYNDVLTKTSVESDDRKYYAYLFAEDGEGGNKRVMFNSWGYYKEDWQWLKSEIERQSLEKYRAGEYKLGRLNKYGQRLSIRIELPHRNGGGTVSFTAGWMVLPHGKLRLNTPYGGD